MPPPMLNPRIKLSPWRSLWISILCWKGKEIKQLSTVTKVEEISSAFQTQMLQLQSDCLSQRSHDTAQHLDYSDFPACLGIRGNNSKSRAGLFKHDSCLDNQQSLMTSLILLVIHMPYVPASPISRNNNLLLGWFFFRVTFVTRGSLLTAPRTKASDQLCALCQHCRNASCCNS